MIPIRKIDEICKAWVDSIDNLENYALVAEDNHATRKLGDRQGIQLLAVIPSFQGGGRPGMVSGTNAIMLWVISKGWTGQTDEEELSQYEQTQNIILQIRDAIIESQADGCGPFWRLEPGSITIDPDYNCFGGWNGWTMQLVF